MSLITNIEAGEMAPAAISRAAVIACSSSVPIINAPLGVGASPCFDTSNATSPVSEEIAGSSPLWSSADR